MENKKTLGWIRVQNWLGKLTLYVFGGLWFIISMYPHAMADLFLTDREVPDWGTTADVLQLVAQASLILGGVFLNRLIDYFTSKK